MAFHPDGTPLEGPAGQDRVISDPGSAKQSPPAEGFLEGWHSIRMGLPWRVLLVRTAGCAANTRTARA